MGMKRRFQQRKPFLGMNSGALRIVEILRKANYRGDLCVEDESLGKFPAAEQADVLANINRATCDALMRLTGAPENLTIVQASPTEIAIVSFDGEPKVVVSPSTTRAFWKTVTLVESTTWPTAATCSAAGRAA